MNIDEVKNHIKDKVGSTKLTTIFKAGGASALLFAGGQALMANDTAMELQDKLLQESAVLQPLSSEQSFCYKVSRDALSSYGQFVENKDSIIRSKCGIDDSFEKTKKLLRPK